MYLFAVIFASIVLMYAFHKNSKENGNNGIWDHDFDNLP